MQRCTNPKAPAWPDYGGRGITVCAAWRASFEAFFAYVGPRPSPEHEIDRIENDRGYEPGNVRWATVVRNMRNRRNTFYVDVDGRRVSVCDLVEELGGVVDRRVAEKRIARGWDPVRAASTPLLRHPRREHLRKVAS